MRFGRFFAVIAWASLLLSPLLRPIAVPEVPERAAVHAPHERHAVDAGHADGVPCESAESTSLEEDLDAKHMTGDSCLPSLLAGGLAESAELAEPRHRRERPLLPPPNKSASLA